jgi:hypothetical protein
MSSMRLLLGTFAIGLGVVVASGAAQATTVSFGDAVRYWPGHRNFTGDDSRDTIGTPDLLGGRATFDDATGRLQSVQIDYNGRFSPVASGDARVIPGDLFLDVGQDGDWDYVVKMVAGPQTPVANYASLSILDVHGLANSYLMSGSDDTGYWAGYGIRDRHPYAWNGGGTAVGTASFGAFDQLANGGMLSFDLGALGVPTRSNVRIGFAPSCANDVLLANVSAPVPEPTAALIFGVGLIAATHSQRRFRRA